MKHMLDDFMTYKIVTGDDNSNKDLDDTFYDDELIDEFNYEKINNDLEDDDEYEVDDFDSQIDENLETDNNSSKNYSKKLSFINKSDDTSVDKTINISIDLGKTTKEIINNLENTLKCELEDDYYCEDNNMDFSCDDSLLIPQAKMCIEVENVTSKELSEIMKKIMDSLNKK